MIFGRSADGKAFIIFEPRNLVELKQSAVQSTPYEDLFVCYTPDVEWAKQMLGEKPLAFEAVASILKASLCRKEIVHYTAQNVTARELTFTVVEGAVDLTDSHHPGILDAMHSGTDRLVRHKHITWKCPYCPDSGGLCEDYVMLREYFSVECPQTKRQFLVHVAQEQLQ